MLGRLQDAHLGCKNYEALQEKRVEFIIPTLKQTSSMHRSSNAEVLLKSISYRLYS